MNEHTVLKQSSWCVVRPQERQYVVYNTRSDELYLLPQAAFYVYQLCNGINTVRDLEILLQNAFTSNPEIFNEKLNEFLKKLLERGILEVDE